jgi:hypothetical protein
MRSFFLRLRLAAFGLDVISAVVVRFASGGVCRSALGVSSKSGAIDRRLLSLFCFGIGIGRRFGFRLGFVWAQG